MNFFDTYYKRCENGVQEISTLEEAKSQTEDDETEHYIWNSYFTHCLCGCRKRTYSKYM